MPGAVPGEPAIPVRRDPSPYLVQAGNDFLHQCHALRSFGYGDGSGVLFRDLSQGKRGSENVDNPAGGIWPLRIQIEDFRHTRVEFGMDLRRVWGDQNRTIVYNFP